MRFQITMAKVLSIILMILDIDLIQKFLYKIETARWFLQQTDSLRSTI